MEITVVRNPASGRGRRQPVVEALKQRFPNARILLTCGPGHASKLAADAATSSDLVIAAGGDGTINEVATGLVGTSAKLGILPLGTGNDLARCLGISRNNCLDVISCGVVREIDVGTWHCSSQRGYFVNVAGCGFDAAVAARINQGYRLLTGTAAYLAAVMGTLRAYRAAELCIEIDGIEHRHNAMLCAVANATSYGGGMLVAPHADPSDGMLDVVVVQDVSRVEFLRAFPRVFKGTHMSHPRVRAHHGKKVAIRSGAAMPVLADGEIVGVTPVEFGLLEHGIQVLVPASA